MKKNKTKAVVPMSLPKKKIVDKTNSPRKNIFLNKKLFFLGILAIFAIGGIVFWRVSVDRMKDIDSYHLLRGYESTRSGFMLKSSETSTKMVERAVGELKQRKLKEAIEYCRIAIEMFPINANAYILLAKIYLMAGQENSIYQVLTLAGKSYPNFDNIVGIIDDENLAKIPLEEPQDKIYFANFPENKRMAMTFMFDDGEANIYDALPTFEKYGLRATVPVIAGFVANHDNDPFWGSWNEWKDAAARGFEIANHSMYHRDFKNLHGSEFDISIDQAKQMIEKNTGIKVKTFVFPHDSYNDEAVQRALMGHQFIRTPEFLSANYKRTVEVVYGGPNFGVKTADRLVDIGINRHLWLIAKCHGITDQKSMRSFKAITPQFLDENLAYIHSRQKDVWVDTFAHVLEYLSLRSQVMIKVKNSSANAIDFVLHHQGAVKDKLALLTVVIKTSGPVKDFSAQTDNGQQFKAWSCGADKLCVDADVFEDNIHVEWKAS